MTKPKVGEIWKCSVKNNSEEFWSLWRFNGSEFDYITNRNGYIAKKKEIIELKHFLKGETGRGYGETKWTRMTREEKARFL